VAERRGDWRTRLASAAVLAPLAVAATFGGVWAFAVIVFVAALLVAREWGGLLDRAVRWFAPYAALALITCVVTVLGEPGGALVLVAAVALVLVLASAVVDRDFAWMALGGVYIGVPCIALIWLRAEPETGLASVLWVFGVVWATDVGAFATGRLVGGPKLAPRLSPAKTWSGAVGGLLAGALVGLGVATLTELAPSRSAIAVAFGLSLLLSVAGQLGDLFESAIKRRFGVKDSGALIPGHGGVLDRLDSLLFAAPMAAGLMVIRGDGGALWR
jgi:phosphatidate cytidylyltransferase